MLKKAFIQDPLKMLKMHYQNKVLTFEDFKALISPAAAFMLEEMAGISNKLTQERFGKIIQLYEPMYLSNYCINGCTYCGFNVNNKISRKILTDDEITQEAAKIKSFGYDNILILTGESPKAGAGYIKNAMKLLKPYFSQISIEVQPLMTAEYRELISEGLHAVLLYQETFNSEKYRDYHRSGKKSDFYFRLETHERLGIAEVRKMGLGILLGLRIGALILFLSLCTWLILKKNIGKPSIQYLFRD